MAIDMSPGNCRLLRSERGRYFFVPRGTPIPPGTLLVQDEDGKTEWLKAGTAAHWEIRPDFAELILQQRARSAGQQAAALFDTLLGALGATQDDPIASFAALAKASSGSSEHRKELKQRLDSALLQEQRPEMKQAIAMLEEALLRET